MSICTQSHGHKVFFKNADSGRATGGIRFVLSLFFSKLCRTQPDEKHYLKTGVARRRGLPAATDGDRVGTFGLTPLPFTGKKKINQYIYVR